MNKEFQRYILLVVIFMFTACGHTSKKTNTTFDHQEKSYLQKLGNDLDSILEWRSNSVSNEIQNFLSSYEGLQERNDWIIMQTFKFNPEMDSVLIFDHDSNNKWQRNCGRQSFSLEPEIITEIDSIVNSLSEPPFLYDLSLETLHNEMYFLTIKVQGVVKRRVILNPTMTSQEVLKLSRHFMDMSKLALRLEVVGFQAPECV